MTAEQFAYWLQGYAELNEAPPSAEQWKAIRDHLALALAKVTPAYTPQIGVEPQPYRWVSPTVVEDPWSHGTAIFC